MISISLHLAMYCQAAWVQTMLLLHWMLQPLMLLLLPLLLLQQTDILQAFGYVC